MSDAMRELYQGVILDHYRNPRNYGVPNPVTLHATGHNPLCGDRVTAYVTLEGDSLKSVMFEGVGCAICMASSSMMTERVRGLTVAEALVEFETIHQLFVSDFTDAPSASLGDMVALAGVREYPIRIKCATLPWHALRSALSQQPDATTE